MLLGVGAHRVKRLMLMKDLKVIFQLFQRERRILRGDSKTRRKDLKIHMGMMMVMMIMRKGPMRVMRGKKKRRLR